MSTLNSLLDIIRVIILDFQETKLETGISRHLKIKAIDKKATVCIGVRRSGKSTYLFQVMQGLLDKGVSKHNLVHLNFFDDRLHNLQHDGLGVITEAYYSLYPEKKNTEIVYYFLDEIQIVLGWELFVERLMRTEQCVVYITGSSAHMLSKEIATQLRGRALSWEIFPFSFREFLDYKKFDELNPLSTKKRLLVQKAFEEYWQTGGFPEVLSLDRHLRIKVHQEYFHAILFRDLIERHNVSHPKAIVDLAHWLVDNTASLYSINNLMGYLKSLGHKISKSVISDYLEWFEDAYFLFTVHVFDASLTRRNANPKKIYCIDHSLVMSVASGILVNTGHLLENLVFVTLRRLCSEVYYYKTKNAREVDFIVTIPGPNRLQMLIQVCESMSHAQTRKREITVLNEAMIELGLKSGMIVTRNEQEQIEIDDKTIEVVPIWRFLLDVSLMSEGDFL